MASAFGWKSTEEGERVVVHLWGKIDEVSDLADLGAFLSQRTKVRLDLQGIERINSCGVREWVNLLQTLPAFQEFDFVHCSPAIVSQLNMITNFSRGAVVRSVQAPFVCETCGEETTQTVAVQRGQVPTLQEVLCSSCGDPMEFDHLEDTFFAFLNT